MWVCTRKSVPPGTRPFTRNKEVVKIVVRQGIIHVHSVIVLSMSKDHLYLSADTKQKYPEVAGGSTFSVYLDANERTLGVVKRKKRLPMTEIVVEGLEGEWHLVAEARRYSVSIILARMSLVRYSLDKKAHKKYEQLDWYDDGK